MPSHYDDGEYKGNEHSADIFKAPPKEKTAGEKLEESGEYIDSGEGVDAEGNLLQSVGEGALGVGKGALWGLQKYGEGIDWTNKQVNLRNALMMNPANRLMSTKDAPDWVIYTSLSAYTDELPQTNINAASVLKISLFFISLFSFGCVRELKLP